MLTDALLPLVFVVTDRFTSTCAFAASTRPVMHKIPTSKNMGVMLPHLYVAAQDETSW
jgi:hypothetical protein